MYLALSEDQGWPWELRDTDGSVVAHIAPLSAEEAPNGIEFRWALVVSDHELTRAEDSGVPTDGRSLSLRGAHEQSQNAAYALRSVGQPPPGRMSPDILQKAKTIVDALKKHPALAQAVYDLLTGVTFSRAPE